MVFKSKVDIWLGSIIWASALLCYLPIFLEDGLVIGLILGTVMTSLFSYMWFQTKYTVQDGELIIGGGPFKQRVSITEIKKIRPTNNLLSAPALSIDRLEISYGTVWDFVLVSPKERDRFIEELLKVNPFIQVETKKY